MNQTKRNHFENVFNFLKGQRCNVWIRKEEDPLFEGELSEFTGLYFVFKNVVFWNGSFFADYKFYAIRVYKIEVK